MRKKGKGSKKTLRYNTKKAILELQDQMDSEIDRAMDFTLCLDVHIHTIHLPRYSR